MTDFDRATGFRIEYEDGDTEDVTLKTLVRPRLPRSPACAGPGAHSPCASAAPQEKLLVDAPKEPPKGPYQGSSEMPKRTNNPSSTLNQYINNSRAGARRKRKHTDLKRSGILERRRLENEAAATRAAPPKSVPLHKAPSWAEGISREGRDLQCDATQIGEQSKVQHAWRAEHDFSLYRLKLEVHSADSVTVHWWFPPANPGSQNAWIGLYQAKHVSWNEDCGEVGGGTHKLRWRLITVDKQYGKMKFSDLFGASSPGDLDGEYCFALMPDYGTVCKAVSERFQVRARKAVAVIADSALISDSGLGIHRRDRQQSASLGLITVKKAPDNTVEVEDERCYFPVHAVTVALNGDGTNAHPPLKDIYRIVDKESYLDWGLTSDYLGGEAEADDEYRLRKKTASAADAAAPAMPSCVVAQYSELLPAAAPRAKRGAEHMGTGRGLGGGTLGSEGYGEATMASVAKMGVLLQNLRQLVLQDLCPFIHWGLLWDLGPHSSFLDIGSGYGKVVMHLRLAVGMRKAVGVECVGSRVQIANKALYTINVEDITRACKEKAGDGAAAKKEDAATEEAGHPEDDAASAGSSACTDAAPRPDAADAPAGVGALVASVPWLPPDAFRGVEFHHSDVTREERLQYTHIYIFDWVFSKHTLHAVAELLQRSPFYVMLSTRKCAEWWSYGLVKVQPVARLTGFKTTGGEGMPMYVYVNLEKVGAPALPWTSPAPAPWPPRIPPSLSMAGAAAAAVSSGVSCLSMQPEAPTDSLIALVFARCTCMRARPVSRTL